MLCGTTETKDRHANNAVKTTQTLTTKSEAKKNQVKNATNSKSLVFSKGAIQAIHFISLIQNFFFNEVYRL